MRPSVFVKYINKTTHKDIYIFSYLFIIKKSYLNIYIILISFSDNFRFYDKNDKCYNNKNRSQ